MREMVFAEAVAGAGPGPSVLLAVSVGRDAGRTGSACLLGLNGVNRGGDARSRGPGNVPLATVTAAIGPGPFGTSLLERMKSSRASPELITVVTTTLA